MQKIQIKVARLNGANLSKVVLLLCGLSSISGIYAGNCSYGVCRGIDDRPCSEKVTCTYSSSSGSSLNHSSNSQANTQAVIGAVQSAIGIWAEASQKQAAEREQQREREQAAYDAKKKQERDQFKQYVSQVKDDPDTNPWASFASDKKDKKQDKKRGDINLGTCVEQNFSSQSNGQFVLRNTCNYAINLKYIFSSSKPFSGTYTTLRSNEMTFETGKQGESVKYYMCPVPQTPQTLDGGCI